MKKPYLFILLLFISFSCKPENPWVKKLMKKPLHSDSIAMFKITISQCNKFDEDSSTYQALLYYSGKKMNGAKELYIDFPNFGFSYYKLGDSAFIFDKVVKKQYQSDLKTDSLLYYTDIEIQMETTEPIFMPTFYQPGFMSTKAKDFTTNENNCIGLTYKTMPPSPLMSMGYEMKMTEMFAKPCSVFAVIDTINYCFKSLYMKMDTSKIMGNNPISINYNFDKLAMTSLTNDSIRQVIANYKKAFMPSPIDDSFVFEKLKKKARNKIIDATNPENTSDNSQKYLIPFLTTNGDTVRINDFKGKYVLLDFWFTNCPACIKGIPKVNAIFEKYKNMMVLGINPVDKNLNAIRDVVVKREMKYLACKAPQYYEKLLKVPYFPTYILLSPDQKTYQTVKLQTEEDLTSFMKMMDKKLK